MLWARTTWLACSTARLTTWRQECSRRDDPSLGGKLKVDSVVCAVLYITQLIYMDFLKMFLHASTRYVTHPSVASRCRQKPFHLHTDGPFHQNTVVNSQKTVRLKYQILYVSRSR